MLYIIHILLEFLFLEKSLSTIHLNYATDLWLHVMALRLSQGVSILILHESRSGINQAHVAFYDIEELGEFIQREVVRSSLFRGQAATVRAGAA